MSLTKGTIIKYSDKYNLKDIVKENKDKTVLISFYANWCPPCIKMEGNLETFCKKTGYCAVLICVEENEDIAEIFNVDDVPHIFVFHKGHKIFDFIGSGEENLDKIIEKVKETEK